MDQRDRQSGQGAGNQSGQGQEKQSAVNVSLFPTPLHGMLVRDRQSIPVRILAFGDVPGQSPSYLIVNEEGKGTWESFEDVVIIDTSCAPLSFDALQKLAADISTVTGGSTTQRNRR